MRRRGGRRCWEWMGRDLTRWAGIAIGIAIGGGRRGGTIGVIVVMIGVEGLMIDVEMIGVEGSMIGVEVTMIGVIVVSVEGLMIGVMIGVVLPLLLLPTTTVAVPNVPAKWTSAMDLVKIGIDAPSKRPICASPVVLTVLIQLSAGSRRRRRVRGCLKWEGLV